MKLNIVKVFRYYFPSVFEMYMVGVIFILFSFPGIGLIFIHNDPKFPKMVTDLRGVGIVWGLGTCLIGLFLLFCAVRDSAPAGTLAFRLTHPRFLPRDE
jgi:hypothetical protein